MAYQDSIYLFCRSPCPPLTCTRLCNPGDHHWHTADSIQVLLRLTWLYSKHHLFVDLCWCSIWKKNIIWVRKWDKQVKKDDVQVTKSGNIQPIYSLMLQWRTEIQSHQHIWRKSKHYRKQNYFIIRSTHLFSGVPHIKRSSLRRLFFCCFSPCLVSVLSYMHFTEGGLLTADGQ